MDKILLIGAGGHARSCIDVLEEDVSQYIARSSLSIIQDDDRLEKEIKSIVRQTALAEIGKKPEVSIIISRLS